MMASAAVLIRPVPPPVAPENLPVPPTMVCVICKNKGALGPAANEFPGNATPTTLSCITRVLPSSKTIVRRSQLGPHAPNTTHWNATWPAPLIVALPHDPPGTAPPTSTNVPLYEDVVDAEADIVMSSASTRPRSATVVSFFIPFLSLRLLHRGSAASAFAPGISPVLCL